MQECPSCLESFSNDEMVLPHCGESRHSACRDCTMQWYQKQSNEPCMVCRVGKRSDKLNLFLLTFLFGVMCSFLTVLIMTLQGWFILVLKLYTYSMFYLYFKQIPTAMTSKELVFVFFVGFNITLYACILMFIYLCYSACRNILYVIYNFVIMLVNIHSLHFACTRASTEETRKWLSIVNFVNKIASVSFFCYQAYQIITASE